MEKPKTCEGLKNIMEGAATGPINGGRKYEES